MKKGDSVSLRMSVCLYVFLSICEVNAARQQLVGMVVDVVFLARNTATEKELFNFNFNLIIDCMA